MKMQFAALIASSEAWLNKIKLTMQPDQYGEGTVWHRRTREREHAFRYRLWFALVDVDRLQHRLAASRGWSSRRFAPVSFYRPDFIRPLKDSIGDAVRSCVEQELGRRPSGQVRLLTQPRQWGLSFNPVSFYFCYQADHDGPDGNNGQLDSIVAEVHNTPWGERHAYVLDARKTDSASREIEFKFDKVFHVSPFLPMDMQYQWRFRLKQDSLAIHMLVMQQDAESLRTSMQLCLKPLDAEAMRRLPIKFPLQAIKVVGGIYWQALRLWLKRIRFYSHPRHAE